LQERKSACTGGEGRERGPRHNLGNGAAAVEGEAKQAAEAADSAGAQRRDVKDEFAGAGAGAGGRTSSGEGDMGSVARRHGGRRQVGGSERGRVGGFANPVADETIYF
jgi:hypothetical protein